MPDKPKDIYELYKSARPHNALGFFADPQAGKQMAGDLTNALTRGALGVFGAPVDMLTMGARALGYGVPDDRVVGSSEWMGRQLENAGMLSKNRNQLAELLTGFVSPDPIDFAKMSAMALPVVSRAGKMDDILDLYHGSYEKIGKIEDKGIFGGIFASPEKDAALSHGDNLHKISISKDSVLKNHDLNYELDYGDVKKALLRHLKIDDPTDEQLDAAWKAVIEDKSGRVDNDILSELFYGDNPADIGWDVQRVRGAVAKDLGYKAVEMADEHGASYLVLPGVPIDHQ